MTSHPYAIETEGLTKRFGTTQALAGIDLAVRERTVLSVLGPNGAGKTTAVRILATLITADLGSARVAGFDVVRDARQVRQIVQPRDRRGRERGIRAIRQRRPAPQRQCALQHRRSGRRIAATQRGGAVSRQPLEPVHVHVTGIGQ